MNNYFIEDINLNYNNSVYLELIKKIKLLKKFNKPLLIKINSHSCCGKTTFIINNNKNYRGLILYDFDWYSDDSRSSKLLEEKENNSVLFGCFHNEKKVLKNLVYLYVICPLNELYRNIVHRQLKQKRESYYNDPIHIKKIRKRIYSKIIKNKNQIEPLFYSFETALDFCIKAYND